MIKNILISLIMISILVIPTSGQLNTDVSSAPFSDELNAGESFEWRIDNYQIGTTRVETSNPDSFDFIHGSTIELKIKKDPSGLDLAEIDDIAIAEGYSEYFELKYDDNSFDFSYASPLYIWIFPPVGKNPSGGDIDLISNFWIYNVYNILRNGESLNFNSTLPDGDVSTDVNTDDDLITVNMELNSEDSSIRAEVQKSTGVMTELSYISHSPDFRIEIDRRGAGGGFLPISLWYLIPLVTLPILMKRLRR